MKKKLICITKQTAILNGLQVVLRRFYLSQLAVLTTPPIIAADCCLTLVQGFLAGNTQPYTSDSLTAGLGYDCATFLALP